MNLTTRSRFGLTSRGGLSKKDKFNRTFDGPTNDPYAPLCPWRMSSTDKKDLLLQENLMKQKLDLRCTSLDPRAEAEKNTGVTFLHQNEKIKLERLHKANQGKILALTSRNYRPTAANPPKFTPKSPRDPNSESEAEILTKHRLGSQTDRLCHTTETINKFTTLKGKKPLSQIFSKHPLYDDININMNSLLDSKSQTPPLNRKIFSHQPFAFSSKRNLGFEFADPHNFSRTAKFPLQISQIFSGLAISPNPKPQPSAMSGFVPK